MQAQAFPAHSNETAKRNLDFTENRQVNVGEVSLSILDNYLQSLSTLAPAQRNRVLPRFLNRF